VGRGLDPPTEKHIFVPFPKTAILMVKIRLRSLPPFSIPTPDGLETVFFFFSRRSRERGQRSYH